MDAEQLRAFIAVTESSSFSGAGERLHLTQPAVSKRIAALETHLGQRLLDRVGRRVRLTEAGRLLLPRARQLLSDMEGTERLLADLAAPVAGPLQVGTSHHIGLRRLPPALQEFARRYPQVELELTFQASEQICRAVAEGALDLGVVTLPPQARAPLALTPLWTDPLFAVCGDDHPLAGRAADAPLSLAELAACPAVLPDAGTFTRRLIEAPFRAQGLELRVKLATNYLETLRMMATIGLGWSVLPGTLLDPALRVLPTAFQAERRLGVIRHAAITPSRAAQAFAAILQQHADVPAPAAPPTFF